MADATSHRQKSDCLRCRGITSKVAIWMGSAFQVTCNEAAFEVGKSVSGEVCDGFGGVETVSSAHCVQGHAVTY